MTQEEKQLLLKDLLARLLYGVKCKYYDFCEGNYIEGTIRGFERQEYLQIDGVCIHIENVKPYLRPLSSMTKEEAWEWEKVSKMAVCMEDKYLDAYNAHLSVDWLDAHYFDYRGLIEKGLALEAPKGMYQH